MGLPAIDNNGSSQDTEALYREHGAAVARLCRSLLRDHAEAEDATQQVFLSAHRALLNGSAPREPLAWLLAVARHECYGRFRRRPPFEASTEDVPDGTSPDASVQVLRAGELASMWDEVARMPPAQREAFLLREIRGLSYGQLADELSLSRPSVRSLLVRARTRLRHRLRDATAAFGGMPWVQGLLAGCDGTSSVPAATKAAVVGIGALALVGGGAPARVTHRALPTRVHETAHHRAHARVHRAATPTGISAPTLEDRSARSVGHLEVEHSRTRDDGSRASVYGVSGSTGGSGDGSRHGSDDTTAIAQPTTVTDGGSGTSTSSGRDGSSHDSSHGGSSGPGSGADGGSSSTTTTTTTSSGSDGSGTGGHDGGSSTPDG